MCLLSASNVARRTEEMKFSFQLLSINYNLNGHIWLVTTTSGSASLKAALKIQKSVNVCIYACCLYIFSLYLSIHPSIHPSILYIFLMKGREEGRKASPEATYQDQVNLCGLAGSAVGNFAKMHHAFSILHK